MDVAGSVVGIASLVGQIGQGIKFLCDFFGDITDAPQEIIALSSALDALVPLLDRMAMWGAVSSSAESPHISPAVLDESSAALVNCKAAVEKIRSFILRYESDVQSTGRKKRLWAQFNIAARQKKLQKYLCDLERAKSTLHKAHLGVILDQVEQTNRTTGAISGQISSISLSQTSITNTATETRSTVMDMSLKLDHLNAEIQALALKDEATDPPAWLRPTLESILEEQTKAQQPPTAPPGHNVPREYSINDVAHKNDDATAGKSSSNSDTGPLVHKRPPPSHTTRSIPNQPVCFANRIRHKSTTVRKYLVATVITSTEEERTESGVSRTMTRVFILPSAWLSRRGVLLTIVQNVSTTLRYSPEYRLRPIAIFTTADPIFEATLTTNVSKIRQLFVEGSASPYAMMPDGLNLLHILAYFLKYLSVRLYARYEEESVRTWLDAADEEFWNEDIKVLETKWANSKYLFRWLVSLGVDPGAKADNGM
jgi:hypothetical protein